MEPDDTRYEDPRITRTRNHVVLSARALMDQGGADAVTFSAMSARTGLSRQTLYNHWPTRERLLAALILDDAGTSYPKPTKDLQRSVAGWLRSLRDSLTPPSPTADAMATIIVHARNDEGSREAIHQVIEDRRKALDQHIAELRKPLTDTEWAQLIGPLFYRLFFSFEPVDSAFLNKLAAGLNPTPIARNGAAKRSTKAAS
jgi:AcrR family transcriptional regulator